jgi:transposase
MILQALMLPPCKPHGLNPYHYYVKLLKSLPHCHLLEDYEALLPWNIHKIMALEIT